MSNVDQSEASANKMNDSNKAENANCGGNTPMDTGIDIADLVGTVPEKMEFETDLNKDSNVHQGVESVEQTFLKAKASAKESIEKSDISRGTTLTGSDTLDTGNSPVQDESSSDTIDYCPDVPDITIVHADSSSQDCEQKDPENAAKRNDSQVQATEKVMDTSALSEKIETTVPSPLDAPVQKDAALVALGSEKDIKADSNQSKNLGTIASRQGFTGLTDTSGQKDVERTVPGDIGNTTCVADSTKDIANSSEQKDINIAIGENVKDTIDKILVSKVNEVENSEANTSGQKDTMASPSGNVLDFTKVTDTAKVITCTSEQKIIQVPVTENMPETLDCIGSTQQTASDIPAIEKVQSLPEMGNSSVQKRIGVTVVEDTKTSSDKAVTVKSEVGSSEPKDTDIPDLENRNISDSVAIDEQRETPSSTIEQKDTCAGSAEAGSNSANKTEGSAEKMTDVEVTDPSAENKIFADSNVIDQQRENSTLANEPKKIQADASENESNPLPTADGPVVEKPDVEMLDPLIEDQQAESTAFASEPKGICAGSALGESNSAPKTDDSAEEMADAQIISQAAESRNIVESVAIDEQRDTPALANEWKETSADSSKEMSNSAFVTDGSVEEVSGVEILDPIVEDHLQEPPAFANEPEKICAGSSVESNTTPISDGSAKTMSDVEKLDQPEENRIFANSVAIDGQRVTPALVTETKEKCPGSSKEDLNDDSTEESTDGVITNQAAESRKTTEKSSSAPKTDGSTDEMTDFDIVDSKVDASRKKNEPSGSYEGSSYGEPDPTLTASNSRTDDAEVIVCGNGQQEEPKDNIRIVESDNSMQIDVCSHVLDKAITKEETIANETKETSGDSSKEESNDGPAEEMTGIEITNQAAESRKVADSVAIDEQKEAPDLAGEPKKKKVPTATLR